MATGDSCPLEQSQNDQLDIGFVRRAGEQIGSFACRRVHERRVDSCEQLRHTGFAINGSGDAAPDLRDQLGGLIGRILCILGFLSG